MNISIKRHDTMSNPAWIERIYTLNLLTQQVAYYFPVGRVILKCECKYDDFLVPLILCTLYDATITTLYTRANAYVHPLTCDVQVSKWRPIFQCVGEVLKEDALNQFVSFYGV